MYQSYTDFTRLIPAVTGAPMLSGGFIGAPLVETKTGWVSATDLKPSDSLYTFDGGLCTLKAVHRSQLSSGSVVHIPGGALHNCSDLMVLAQQTLMVDIPDGEDRFGAPCMLMPASALIGHNDISLQELSTPVAQTILDFGQEEIVFANTGIMLHCPAVADDETRHAESTFFPSLDYAEARSALYLPTPVQKPAALVRVA